MKNPQLYLQQTDAKGRGVYTRKPIKEGVIIESSPVIIMSNEDRLHLDQTLLHDYIFEWQPDGAAMCCVALGWVSLYNHSYTSNCEYYMDYDTDTIYIQAIRDIDAGEEVTINYNGTWDKEDKLWFDVK
ncbi:MAG: SET domain-containing protein-lysine N-methyltransferase [Taibaiella sp.]|nr:SET domain-containing protein-lysine N-methyltransferase [Taibaiella sp.]